MDQLAAQKTIYFTPLLTYFSPPMWTPTPSAGWFFHFGHFRTTGLNNKYHTGRMHNIFRKSVELKLTLVGYAILGLCILLWEECIILLKKSVDNLILSAQRCINRKISSTCHPLNNKQMMFRYESYVFAHQEPQKCIISRSKNQKISGEGE